VGEGWVRIADDDVLRQMVEGLGAAVDVMDAPFEPEAGAYGGHHHGHTGEQGRAVIHQFGDVGKQSVAKTG